MNRKKQIKYFDGNTAAAYGVLLCRPDVIAVYPITPQTQLAEMLAKFKAQGILDAEIVEVEGETSAIGVVYGASAGGGRVFTATSGAGLQFMHDGYVMAGMARLPIVMVNVSREINAPWLVAASEQDIMGELDSGWIHMHMENCQEIIDSLIMAYRLAEDPEIQNAVIVNYDGYYLSHLSERIEIPSQDDVDRFLPSLSPDFPRLNKGTIACGVSFIPPEEVAEYRRRQLSALERAKNKIDTIDKEFEAIFGRSYGGQIDKYRMEDAEIALIVIGSCAGTARVAVDRKREQGIKVGLVKVRVFRPFPEEKLAGTLRGLKAIGVIDRNVCFGWNCGHLFMELKATLYNKARVPLLNFIGGLGGGDITGEHIERSIDMIRDASQDKSVKEVTWLALE
jgi:pyruvate/2-oxoacid:ferredoxin oxidoreductase alpha subunit